MVKESGVKMPRAKRLGQTLLLTDLHGGFVGE